MRHAKAIGRLGMLAVGLCIGVAVASTPGIASADTPGTDPFSWLAGLDPGDLSAAALPAASPFDLDISVDGFTLLDLGTGATATSGTGDIAIAFGADSSATAEGGFGDYALATGGATAIAGDPTSSATGNNFDSATANGFDSTAWSGNGVGFPDTIGSSFDSASANSGSATGTEGANAYAGFNGSGDSASALGQGAASYAGFSSNAAGPANFDSASVVGNVTTPTQDLAIAGSGSGAGGSSDTAFVLDPSGTVGSSAIAGEGFNSDLAGVFGDALHASATTASNLVDILPSL
jgi:hypothetical protein